MIRLSDKRVKFWDVSAGIIRVVRGNCTSFRVIALVKVYVCHMKILCLLCESIFKVGNILPLLCLVSLELISTFFNLNLFPDDFCPMYLMLIIDHVQ